MNSLTITIPLPPKGLGQNGRSHWARKAKATKGYRKAAWAAAMNAMQREGVTAPGWLKASVQVTAYYPTFNAPDPTNLLDRLKACFDGIEDSGLIANDKGLWPERPVILKDAVNPRIELTIKEEKE